MKPRQTRRAHAPAVALVLLGLAAHAGCARQPAPDSPAPPMLEGERVMLLPVRIGEPDAVNAELARWLPERSPATDWILPDELQRTLDRQPAWRVRLNALPRTIAQASGRGPHLVDPTYSELRRLAAVVDAFLAVMPVSVRELPGGAAPAMELTAALVDVRGGQVMWLLTVRADGDPERPDAGASAVAEALARAMFPERTMFPD